MVYGNGSLYLGGEIRKRFKLFLKLILQKTLQGKTTNLESIINLVDKDKFEVSKERDPDKAYYILLDILRDPRNINGYPVDVISLESNEKLKAFLMVPGPLYINIVYERDKNKLCIHLSSYAY